jgi:hypothetical protein
MDQTWSWFDAGSGRAVPRAKVKLSAVLLRNGQSGSVRRRFDEIQRTERER